MNLLVTTLVLMYIPQTKGDNIMLGKPSKQSSTSGDNDSTRANDGSISAMSYTYNQESPYWQGDLQGYYRILNITVTRYNWHHIRDAYIGVSVLDVSDPDSDVHKCGQWQANDYSASLNFLCCFQQPMRFVRIWRVDTNYLNIREVSVETQSEQKPRVVTCRGPGCPDLNDLDTTVYSVTTSKYGTDTSKKLTTARTSFTVAMATECGTLCHNDQTCHAFSFRKGGQLNCLLGIPGTLVSDTDWCTYIIKDCYNPPTCPGVIDPST